MITREIIFCIQVTFVTSRWNLVGTWWTIFLGAIHDNNALTIAGGSGLIFWYIIMATTWQGHGKKWPKRKDAAAKETEVEKRWLGGRRRRR